VEPFFVEYSTNTISFHDFSIMPSELYNKRGHENLFYDILNFFGFFDITYFHNFDLLTKFEYLQSYGIFDDILERALYEDATKYFFKDTLDVRNNFFWDHSLKIVPLVPLK